MCCTPVVADRANEPIDITMDEKPFDNYWIAGAYAVPKYLITIGALVVDYVIINFEPPKGTWLGDKIPLVSTAVQCVMILPCQYFLVYGGIQICSRSSSSLVSCSATPTRPKRR